MSSFYFLPFFPHTKRIAQAAGQRFALNAKLRFGSSTRGNEEGLGLAWPWGKREERQGGSWSPTRGRSSPALAAMSWRLADCWHPAREQWK